METKVMLTTAGSLLCLVDDRGTIIGWIPYPVRRDALGPGRGKVYLARPAENLRAVPGATSRAA